MEEKTLRRELCILLCHHLRTKMPEIYQKICDYCTKNDLLPIGCSSIEEALNTRYSSFAEDQFVAFIQSLRPDDDFPSIFRRITPFQKKVETINIHDIKPYSRTFMHLDAIYCMCTDPASRILCTGSDDKLIKVWSLPDLRPIQVFKGHENVITNININPLSTMLVSSSQDKTLRIWSLKTGRCIAILGGFTTDVIHYCCFSPVGSMIAAGCEDGTVHLWTTQDAIQGKPSAYVFKSRGKGAVRWISFSPGGEFIVFSSEPNVVTIVPLKTLNEIILPPDHASVCDFVGFSNHLYSNHGELGPRLITVSNEDGGCNSWLLENLQWKKQHAFKNVGTIGRRASKITCTAVNCDENLLIIARTTGVYIYHLMTGEMLGDIMDCAAARECSAISPHPTIPCIIFIANRTGEVAVINTYTCRIVCQTSLPTDHSFIDACWSYDGRWIFATDVMGSVTTFTINGVGLPDRDIERDCYESLDANRDGTRVFTDRSGVVLQKQPDYLDIRNMDLQLQMLQGPVVQACAAELHIVQRIVSGERVPAPVNDAPSAVAAPPQHIRSSIELPFNPCGPLPVPPPAPSADIDGDDDNAAVKVDITSDTEEWIFDPQNKDEQNEKFVYVEPQFSRTLPQGKEWPKWSTCVLTDDHVYVPHSMDEVMFIREAFEGETIMNESIRAFITQMEVTEEKDTVKVTLTFPSNKEYKLEYVTKYPNPPSLVPLPKYRYATTEFSGSLAKDQKVTLFLHKDWFDFEVVEGTIDNIVRENPYKSIDVTLTDGRQVKVSPWEILMLEGRLIQFPDSSEACKSKQLSLLANIEAVSGEESFQAFARASQNAEFLELPQPMSIDFFRERLGACYYRNLAAMIIDMKLLYECTEKCLVNDEALRDKAKRVLVALQKVIDVHKKE